MANTVEQLASLTIADHGFIGALAACRSLIFGIGGSLNSSKEAGTLLYRGCQFFQATLIYDAQVMLVSTRFSYCERLRLVNTVTVASVFDDAVASLRSQPIFVGHVRSRCYFGSFFWVPRAYECAPQSNKFIEVYFSFVQRN